MVMVYMACAEGSAVGAGRGYRNYFQSRKLLSSLNYFRCYTVILQIHIRTPEHLFGTLKCLTLNAQRI